MTRIWHDLFFFSFLRSSAAHCDTSISSRGSWSNWRPS